MTKDHSDLGLIPRSELILEVRSVLGCAGWRGSGDRYGTGVGDSPVDSVGTENGGEAFSREQGWTWKR